jgi:hypothetical protein
MIRRVLLPCFLLLALIAAGLPLALHSPTTAEAADSLAQARFRFFSETGHAVHSPFLEYWENTPNATFVLGYPISQPFEEESFTNPGEVYTVQYFERAVLEEHPENQGIDNNRYYIQGRLLGQLLAEERLSEPPFQPVADPGDGTWQAATGHTIRNEPAPFRTFWQANGGLEVFGYALSEQFEEVNQADGQTYWVQYFERQRLEWHPENPDAPIQLGLLGNEYRDQHHAENEAFNPIEASEAGPAPEASPFIYGYNVHLFAERDPWQDRSRVLDMSKESGVYWVRQQIAWGDYEPVRGLYDWGELDAVVDDTEEAGVNMLLSVVRSPNWATVDRRNGLPAPENFDAFARFMGQMATRYRGKVDAYQIWNEQNLAHENGGRVANADNYVNMLAMAYDAVKAADPDAIVVSGGPSSTETNHPEIAVSDVEFMRQMLANPNFRADVIGAHPGGQHNPPDTFWPDQPGPGPGWVNSREFYFRRVEDIRQVMVEQGWGDRQIWLTEFGWATQNNTPGYEYGNNNTFEEQAAYIVRAFEKGRYEYSPWMGAMFLWNLNYAVPWKHVESNEQHEQASFGVLNGDWSPRPAWYAIRDIPK